MKGININCKHYPFVEWILSGRKTVETRNRNTLKSLVGQRVGLIETGNGRATLKGYATISEVILYSDRDSFRADEERHMVQEHSKYDIQDKKYGYVLTDVERCEPTHIYSHGIVIRNI